MPELLAPAGSPEALDAAIAGGADAVYFGGGLFNARMNAKNFTGDALREAIDKCRLYGVKTNITLNTLIHDREMDDVLRYVEELYTLGADALIVADLGAAKLIHEYFPDLELHASTQALGHNLEAAKTLAGLGFSRMVAARELSFENLKTLCSRSPIETEMFIHGAICVSQSGGCLASSLIGGRSGNRGECAQPCRLPYGKCQNGAKDSYTKDERANVFALSLKDICLAEHIIEILSLGAASLKIEGRMKSPDYVYGVTRIYRTLLDEGRNATEKEINELRALFSRSGFTDGYFKAKIGREMLGIRTDADKSNTAQASKNINFSEIIKNRRRPIDMRVIIEENKPMTLHASVDTAEVTVQGQAPDKAINRPLTHEAVLKNLEKLGNTPFIIGNCELHLDDGLILPLSALNSLRRDAVDEIIKNLLPRRQSSLPKKLDVPVYQPQNPTKTARFLFYENIPDDVGNTDIIYIPLEKFSPEMCERVNGVILPPVIFDSETDEVESMLRAAADSGITHALVSNLGHISLAKAAGMYIHGDFRLNIFNRWTAQVLYSLGFHDLIASPELTLPKLRDIAVTPIIYGRVPLMTLEKCVIRDLYSCEECEKRGVLSLRDRKGVEFPLVRAYKHRNIMYNSVPIFMSDRKDELTKYRISGGHYIFTTEKKTEISSLLSGKNITPPSGIRRISK